LQIYAFANKWQAIYIAWFGRKYGFLQNKLHSAAKTGGNLF